MTSTKNNDKKRAETPWLRQSPYDNRIQHKHENPTQSLHNAWNKSADILNSVTHNLQKNHQKLTDVHCVVVAGSLARMEATDQSDFDYFVVSRENLRSRTDENQMCDRVWRTIDNHLLVPPDEQGIFTRVLSPEQFCDPQALGDLDYPRHVFGLRLQLLTDSQALLSSANLESLRKQILTWYLTPSHSPFSFSCFQYLVADLKRYFHSYAIWQQYRYDQSYNDSWMMRQIKTSHSRLTSYVSLLVTLAATSERFERDDKNIQQTDLLAYVADQLNLTPLERVVNHWPHSIHQELSQFLSCYNDLLEVLHDADLRDRIIASDPKKVSDRRHSADSNISSDEMQRIVRLCNETGRLLSALLHTVVSQSSPTTARLITL